MQQSVIGWSGGETYQIALLPEYRYSHHQKVLFYLTSTQERLEKSRGVDLSELIGQRYVEAPNSMTKSRITVAVVRI